MEGSTVSTPEPIHAQMPTISPGWYREVDTVQGRAGRAPATGEAVGAVDRLKDPRGHCPGWKCFARDELGQGVGVEVAATGVGGHPAVAEHEDIVG